MSTKMPQEVETFEYLLEQYNKQAKLLETMYWQTIQARMLAVKVLATEDKETTHTLHYPYKYV